MCFHKFSEKSSMLTHNLATDKLRNLSKNHKKTSLQKVCIFNNKSAKIKKASLQKSLQKVCIFIKCKQQVCKNKKASLQKSCKKSAYSKMKTSLHIQKR